MNLRSFDLNLLVIFNSVWVHRNVTRAAEALNLSQSGVSAALSRLRAHFDDDLFIWNGRKMTPTPKAVKLAMALDETLVQIQSAIDVEGREAAQASREFIVASIDYIGATIGADLVTEFRRSAPNFRLDWMDVRPEMFEREAVNDIDLMIAPEVVPAVSHMRRELLYEDRYVGICRRSSSQVPERPSREEFLSAPAAYFSLAPYHIESHEASLFVNNDIGADYRMLTPHYLAIPFLVARSDLVAVVPARVAALTEDILELRRFELPVPTPDIRMMMHWPARLQKDRAHTHLRERLLELAVKPRSSEAPALRQRPRQTEPA